MPLASLILNQKPSSLPVIGSLETRLRNSLSGKLFYSPHIFQRRKGTLDFLEESIDNIELHMRLEIMQCEEEANLSKRLHSINFSKP